MKEYKHLKFRKIYHAQGSLSKTKLRFLGKNSGHILFTQKSLICQFSQDVDGLIGFGVGATGYFILENEFKYGK